MSRKNSNKVSPVQFLAGVAVLGGLALFGYLRGPRGSSTPGGAGGSASPTVVVPHVPSEPSGESIERAIGAKAEEVWVRADAEVVKELPDDKDGAEHQRFLITLESGTTVLVTHNTDVAPRVPVAVGSRVKIRGKYVWNDKGGLIHWTHHNEQRPDEEAGWIQLGGERFE